MQLTSRKLKRSAEHVYYEIWMLHSATMRLQVLLNSQTKDQELLNSILESWCSHLRNLLDFFYTPQSKRYKDDMLAEDFVSDLRSFKKQRTAKKNFKHIHKRVNKQIAHLTYHRNRYNIKTKLWHFRDEYAEIYQTLIAFYESLSPHRKKWLHFVELKKVIDARY